MEFLKNHYEKVILGVVLLALAGVAAWLPMKVNADKAEIERVKNVAKVEPEPREMTDLSDIQDIRKEVENPPEAKFSGSHNTFNSVVWIKMPDGSLEKRLPEDVGVNKLVVNEVEPLDFIIEFDRVSGTGYYFNVTREHAESARDRRKRGFYVSTNSGKGNGVFELKEVRGETTDPLAFVLELKDTGKEVVVSKSRPYHATNGYAAAIVYPPENKTWDDARNKTSLIFAGDTNIIVDINPAEVILRAVSNEKTTTIPVN